MMDKNNFNKRKMIIPLVSILLLIALSSSAFARPVTDSIAGAFGGGLLQINNFFEGRQYEPYSKAIDFFFFAFLFTAIYMMGARYAFKEMKRPEQVIVILLGLMTAFLLVLADISATVLLPYIHWLFYLLLFILFWWLLKGIKNPFWRFLLALLLTILTIALLQGLLNSLRAPDISGIQAPEGPGFGGIGGFFGDLFKGFGGIQLPGVSAPGVPDYLKDYLNIPEVAPSGPETLPPVETPTGKETVPGGGGGAGGGWSWWIKGPLILLILLLLFFAGKWGLGKRQAIIDWWRRRRRTPPTPTPTNLQELINKITEAMQKKREAGNAIEDVIRDKNTLLAQENAKTGYVARLREIQEADLANLFLDESREILDRAQGVTKDILKKDIEFFKVIRTFWKFEHDDILTKLPGWERLILSVPNIPNDKKSQIKGLIDSLRIVISQHVKETEIPQQVNNRAETIAFHAEDKRKGILWLIAFCFNLEQKQAILTKEMQILLDRQHIESLVKGKFKQVLVDEQRLEQYQQQEVDAVALLVRRIGLQIRLLQSLLEILTPVPPPHEDKNSDRFDPTRIKLDPVYEDPIKPDEEIYEPIVQPLRDVELWPWFRHIKNQLNLGSCTAFASCSIYEYMHNRYNYSTLRQDLTQEMVNGSLNKSYEAFVDQKIDLAELHQYFHSRDDKNNDTGSWPSDACRNLQARGVCVEPFWPYIPSLFKTLPPQEAETNAPNQKIERHAALRMEAGDVQRNKERLARALMEELPILVVIDPHGNFIRTIGRPFIEDDEGSGPINRLHSIVIVGYRQNLKIGEQEYGEAFKIRNSWGSKWGYGGWLWMNANYLTQLIMEVNVAPRVMFGQGQEDTGKKNLMKIRKMLAFYLTILKDINEKKIDDETRRNMDLRLKDNHDAGIIDDEVLKFFGLLLDSFQKKDTKTAIQLLSHLKEEFEKIEKEFKDAPSPYRDDIEIIIELANQIRALIDGLIERLSGKSVFEIKIESPKDESRFGLNENIDFDAIINDKIKVSNAREYSYILEKIDENEKIHHITTGFVTSSIIHIRVPASHKWLGAGSHKTRIRLMDRKIPEGRINPLTYYSQIITVHIDKTLRLLSSAASISIRDLSVIPTEASTNGVEFGTPLSISTQIEKGQGRFTGYCYIFKEFIIRKKDGTTKTVYKQVYPYKPESKRQETQIHEYFDQEFMEQYVSASIEQAAKKSRKAAELTKKMKDNVGDVIEFSTRDFGTLRPGAYEAVIHIVDGTGKSASKETRLVVLPAGKPEQIGLGLGSVEAMTEGHTLPEKNITPVQEFSLKLIPVNTPTPLEPMEFSSAQHKDRGDDIEIGKGDDVEVNLEGSPVEDNVQARIRFDESTGRFAVMKSSESPHTELAVNAQKVKASYLKEGDVIDINGYKFKVQIVPALPLQPFNITLDIFPESAKSEPGAPLGTKVDVIWITDATPPYQFDVKYKHESGWQSGAGGTRRIPKETYSPVLERAGKWTATIEITDIKKRTSTNSIEFHIAEGAKPTPPISPTRARGKAPREESEEERRARLAKFLREQGMGDHADEIKRGRSSDDIDELLGRVPD